MRRAKKRKNLSSARHYDQIRFRFHTTKTHLRHRSHPTEVRRTIDECASLTLPRCLVLSRGAAMRQRSRAGGKPPKAQAPKAAARKSHIAPKPVRPRGPSIAREETEVARLTRELTRRESSRRQQRKFCGSSAHRPETCNQFSRRSWRMQRASARPNLAIFGSAKPTNFASSPCTADRLSTANIFSPSPLLLPMRETPSPVLSATGK